MKIKILFCFLILACRSYGTTWTVQVANFQFSPITLNVSVGDVIHFVWVSGSHTTTCNGSSGSVLPAGAAAWNSPMSSSSTVYDYTITAAGNYHYVCIPHSPGMAGDITASAVLPLTLTGFNVVNEGKSMNLNWETSNEINVDRIDIERSYSLKKFETISSVPFKATKPVNHFSYRDNMINNEFRFVYYRLVIIDKDGSKQYSAIQGGKSNHAIRKLITEISPNPVSKHGHLLIRFNSDLETKLFVLVTNNLGVKVLQTEMSANEGLNNGHIHLGGKPPGLYKVKFSLGKQTETYTVILQ
jgi:plastocyanin